MTESAANDRDQDSSASDSSELDDLAAGEYESVDDGSEAGETGETDNGVVQDGEEILPVQFGQLEEPPPTKGKRRARRLHNVSVEVIVELGRTEKSVRELTNLKENDVIDLPK